MTRSHDIQPQSKEYRPNYTEKLPDYLFEHHPDIELDEADIELAAWTLDYLYDRYGDPTSPYHRDYHDDKHTFGVIARTFWQLDFFRDKLGWDINKSDYQAGLLTAVFHDSVLGVAAGEPKVVTITIGNMTLEVTSGGAMTDERLSADLAAEILEHRGYDADMQTRVYDGIILTEVDKSTEDMYPVHDISNVTDPAIIAVFNADTGGIFAGGPQTYIQDVSNLSAEIAGEDTEDVGKITETVMKLVNSEVKFLRTRVDFFNRSIGTRALTAETQARMNQRVDEHLTSYHERAMTFAEWLESNSVAFQDHLKQELEKLKTHAPTPGRKIREGFLRAMSHLPPEK